MIRIFGAAVVVLFFSCSNEPDQLSSKMRPSDHLYWQRAYPETKFDVKGWQQVFDIVKKSEADKHQRNAGTWIQQGPANAGARINTIAVHPLNHQIILIGYSAGGMYKTTNGGQSWKPVFDNFAVLAIGDIVFDQEDPSIVYAGTGDPNISGIPFVGNGIYRSVDMGETWSYLGLKDAGIISEIIIDPDDSRILYAASMGVPFYRDSNRGLYKSINAGQTWSNILYLGDGTGVIDIAMNPENSQIIYAAGWDRIRNYEESTTEGEGARIHQSKDGGKTWTMLSGGLPNQVHSRIGIEIAPSNPDRLYAVYVDLDYELEDIYTSADGGTSWSTIPTKEGSGLGIQPLQAFGWYFGKIRTNPFDEDDLYLLAVRLWRYNAKTKRWSRADQFTGDVVHADKHDLVIIDPDTLLMATDGGLYRSNDNAASWLDIEDIPTTQFYRVAFNPHYPDLFYGGAQDNGSLYGNQSELANWSQYFGGDGFRTIFHPDNANIYYVETQLGNLYVTLDAGQSYEPVNKGIDRSDFINWDAPVIMSIHNPNILYYGTHRVYRNVTGPDENFTPISPLLIDEIVLLDATSNVTCIAESPSDPKVLFAGTGDGNLYRTKDSGTTWQKSDQGLPDRYITAIEFSPQFDSVVYVTHSGFKAGQSFAHVHRSDDLGQNWVDISDNLPELPVNDILILPNNDDQVLFVATDAGVYFSRDAGDHWLRLGSNMPLVPVFDLVYNPVLNYLVAGTHAKSIMTFDLLQESIRGDIETAVSHQDYEEIAIAPNPVTTSLRFSFDENKSSQRIKIIDNGGKIVMQKMLVGNELDVSILAPGIYLVYIVQKDRVRLARFAKM
ncbi:MAG: T9SS type A sorting domain-containing protein [Saprospiraceae bacterium]|nr:T9SS type A sorting domain-containing protein [Saprospiraceae bacterium]